MQSTFTDFGLTINTTNTKSIIFNFHANEEYLKTICEISNVPIENVKIFTYLGTILHCDHANVDEETQHHISAAQSSFQQHKHLLRNFKIHLSIWIKFLNALVRTKLTYGCSAWSASKQQLHRINVCYKTMLRKMIRKGFKLTSDYKYLINDKTLQSICKTINILDFIRLQQTKYLAHIIKKPDLAATKQITFENYVRKKKGRPSNTLKDNVCEYHNLDIKQFSKEALDHQF